MITNVTDTSATVVWTTKEPVGGIVYISKDKKKWSTLSGLGGQAYYDDRDVKTDESGTRELEKVGKYQTHHITVTGLDPESEYYFTTAESKFAIQKSDAVSNTKIRTASTLEQPVMPNTVYGKVIAEGGEFVGDAIVTIKLLGANDEPISGKASSLLAENGTYTLDIANLRNLDLTRVIIDSETEQEEIVVMSEYGVSPSQFVNKDLDQPVPEIRLGKEQEVQVQGLDGVFNPVAKAQAFTCTTGNPSCITLGKDGAGCCEVCCHDSAAKCIAGSVKAWNTGDSNCSGITLKGASAVPAAKPAGGPSAANGWCSSAMCAKEGTGGCPGRDSGTCDANKICDLGETCGNINCNKCQCGTGWIDPGMTCNQDVSLTQAAGFVQGAECDAPTGVKGVLDTVSGVCTDKGYIDLAGKLKLNYTTCKGNDLYKAVRSPEGTVHWVFQKSCVRCDDNPNTTQICFGTPDTDGGKATLKSSACDGNTLKQVYSIKNADGTDGTDETRDTDCTKLVPANICRQKPKADLTDTNPDDFECFIDQSSKYCKNPFDIGCKEGLIYRNLTIGQTYSCVKDDGGVDKVGTWMCQTLGADPVLVAPPGLEEVKQEGGGFASVERTTGTDTTTQRVRLGLGAGGGCKKEDEVEKVCSSNLPIGINMADITIPVGNDLSTGTKATNGKNILVCKGDVSETGGAVTQDYTWNVEATCIDGDWTFVNVGHSGNRDGTECTAYKKLAGSYTAKDVQCIHTLAADVVKGYSAKLSDLVGLYDCIDANSNVVEPVNPSAITLRCSDTDGCKENDELVTTLASLTAKKYESYSSATFQKIGTLSIEGETDRFYCCCGVDASCGVATNPACFTRHDAPDATSAGEDCVCPPIAGSTAFLMSGLSLKTFAQDGTQGDGFQGPGVYAVDLPGYELTTTSVKVVDVDENGNPIVEFFIDSNGNGIYDEGEEIVTDIPIDELSIKKTETGVDFRLNIGWNVLSFPVFAKDEIERTAKGVLKSINDQGIFATQITKYSAGGWSTYTYREDTNEEYGTDFQIVPGEAYFIKSYQRGSFLIVGNEYDKPVPVDFVGGWNLVGVISPGKEYTAEGVLNGLVAADIKADTVSDYSNGMYQNAIKQDGVLYGYDYPIYSKKGYFVRVEDGSSGKWTP
jgi:hypothetical protein